MFTSPGPEAAKKPARATTPDPITDSWTTLEGPRMTSSMRIEFERVVRALIRASLQRLVDGSRTAFGRISEPEPIDNGPWRYAPDRITQPSPIDTRPRIVTAVSIVPERISWRPFRAVALSRSRSHGNKASTQVHAVRTAATEVRFAKVDTALGRSCFPSFASRSISSKIRESRAYAPVLIRFEMTSVGFSVIATRSFPWAVTTP